MNTRLKHLLRLLENSFPGIEHFHEKVITEFEKLENAKSFWSDIYVARLKKKDGVEGLDIPDTVFIKKENLFYKHFSAIPNFPFPKVYFTENVQEEGTGGIVAENLSDRIYELEHIPGLNHEQVLRLMEAFAGFHSHLIGREDKSYVEDFQEGAHGRENWSEEMQKRMFDEVLTLETKNPELFGRIQKIKWAYDYEKKNKAQSQAISDIPGIICHGDMNVTNMLWKKGSNDLAAIIDFQMAFIGSITFDIVRILTLGLDRDTRKSKTEKYLEHYYEILCGLCNGGKPGFSLEELYRQYNLIFPFATNFSLFGISIYIRMYTEGTIGKADKVESNCEELMDRARGIIEDIEGMEKDFN
uniref:CHK domain-containing protein n=1 Tax=Caenorhabditis tropicalis TaxID=1561998 RepID=A0A1I7UV17_9PELO